MIASGDQSEGTPAGTSVGVEYFEHMYRRSPDPWGFGHRWYEERKRALTLAILPRQRFRRAFEPGCSIGNLSTLLTDRCDHIVASDIVDRAVDLTRTHLADAIAANRASVEKWSLRWPWPDDMFDLIVLSEICFHLSAPELDRLVESAVTHLTPDSTVLAAHWRHPVPEYPFTGDGVHAYIRRTSALRSTACYTDADVVIASPCETRPGGDVIFVSATGRMPCPGACNTKPGRCETRPARQRAAAS